MKNLIQRIKMPWSLMRFVYLAFGVYIMTQGIIDRLWFGIIIGLYFLAMGLFAWGCASGSCEVPINKTDKSKLTE